MKRITDKKYSLTAILTNILLSSIIVLIGILSAAIFHRLYVALV